MEWRSALTDLNSLGIALREHPTTMPHRQHQDWSVGSHEFAHL